MDAHNQELANWVAIVCTPIYVLVTGALLWFNTLSVKALKIQLDDQNRLYRSQSSHAILDAHRELYLALISSDDLVRLLKPDELSSEETKKQILGTLLINHCLRNYMDRVKYFDQPVERQSFIADARGVFETDIVRQRWPTVRDFHPPEFVSFIEEKVCPAPAYEA